jgi:hypothetical protein
MKIKLMISILALGSLSIAPALYGQDDKEKKDPQRQDQADRPGMASFTGCLTEQQGAFVITTAAGEQVTAKGSTDLSQHKDHTVKLTGTASDEGGKKTLNVTKIEHVSASCSK